MRRLLLAASLALGLAGVAQGEWSGGSWSAQGAAQGTAAGGTGLTAIGSASQVLGVNTGGTALEYKTVSGTANQVTVTLSAGGIALSGPQSLGTTNVPAFSGVTASTSGVVISGGPLTVAGTVTLSSDTIVDAYSDSFGAVTAGSTSTVTWTEVTDRLAEFVTSSFTATTAGFYEVIAHSGVSQTAGTACLIVKKNGSSFAGGTVCNQGVTGLASILDTSFTRILSLSANDIIRVDASATTANATFQKMALTIKKVP